MDYCGVVKIYACVCCPQEQSRPKHQPKSCAKGEERELACKVKGARLKEVHAVAKAIRPVDNNVENYGDVDHQINKGRVDGMHLQATKNQIDSIKQQIMVMNKNTEMLVDVHVR